jgi:hypothetical protein
MKMFLSLLFLLQGVRMTEDFLPLEAGNQWIYDVASESGQSIGQVEFSVGERQIVSGRSLYALPGYPFAGASVGLGLVGYDRETRQFVRILGTQETPLFPGDSQSAQVLQSDASGVPQRFSLNTGSTTLVLQRGVGIVEARFPTADGIRVAKIRSSRIGKGSAPPPAGGARTSVPDAPVAATGPTVPNVAQVTAENPALILTAESAPGGMKLELLVVNKSDKLLPFKFTSSKIYDFMIIDIATEKEVWRWSRGTVFSQMVRSDSIRGNSKWTYSEIWNRRDNDRNPIPPGRYRVVGILASQPPIQSEPIVLEIK